MARMWQWLTARGRSWRSHPSRQLRLRETLPLGERRFIAVVEFDQQKFLIAGTGNSVAMLTKLANERKANENAGPETTYEEIPTWGFTTQGQSNQLIRR